MVEGCGAKCMKIILFVINILFFLIGGAALGLGIFALVDSSKLASLTKLGSPGEYDAVSLLEAGAYCLVVGGAVVMILAFLGCCGAARDSKCLLCTYAFIIIVIVILEIAAVVLGAIFSNRVQKELTVILQDRIDKEYDGKLSTEDRFTLAMDYAQVFFKCCGVNDWMDYNTTTKWNRTLSTGQEALIPASCCMITDETAFFKNPSTLTPKNANCQYMISDVTSNYKKGCYQSIIDWAKNHAAIVIGIGVGIVVLQILCILFACCLISALRKEDK